MGLLEDVGHKKGLNERDVNSYDFSGATKRYKWDEESLYYLSDCLGNKEEQSLERCRQGFGVQIKYSLEKRFYILDDTQIYEEISSKDSDSILINNLSVKAKFLALYRSYEILQNQLATMFFIPFKYMPFIPATNEYHNSTMIKVRLERTIRDLVDFDPAILSV